MPDPAPHHSPTPSRHEDRVTIWLLALLAMATATAVIVMGALTAQALSRSAANAERITNNTERIERDADAGIARGLANARRVEQLAYRTCVDLNALLVAASRKERDCGSPPG